MAFVTFAKKHLFLKKPRKTVIRKRHLVKKEGGSVLDFKSCQLKMSSILVVVVKWAFVS